MVQGSDRNSGVIKCGRVMPHGFMAVIHAERDKSLSNLGGTAEPEPFRPNMDEVALFIYLGGILDARYQEDS